MLPWKTNYPRCFTGLAYVVVAGCLSSVVGPLLGQTPDTVDDSPPPVIRSPRSAIQATPAPPADSAVSTPADANASGADNGGLSAAGGPIPVSGPGSTDVSDFGDRLNAAAANKRLPFRVTATLGDVYSNNIFAQRRKTGDFITRLSVRGELQFGDPFAVDGNYIDVIYNPNAHIYSRHSHEDGVDQFADALYAHRWTRLTLSLEQIYAKEQTTNAAVGGLVTNNVYTTKAAAAYAYSHKVDVVMSLRQQFTNYNTVGYTNTKEWSGDLYGLYHLDPRLSLGFGPRIGYLKVESAPNETYEQILARAIYVVSDKLNFQAAVGGEDRQYETSARADTLTPVFEFEGVYLPFPSTNMSLHAARRFAPSYNFVGQDYIATSVNGSITQRIFQVYYLGLTVGYENDQYKQVAPVVIDDDHGVFDAKEALETDEPAPEVFVTPTREDNYFYILPSLHWKPNGWLDVAAFDKYEEDNSNTDNFGYASNQVGVSFSATY